MVVINLATPKPRRSRAVLPNGTRVLNGRYEIEKCIHSRGMANVYIVKDLNLGKRWCLKEIIKTDAGKSEIEYVSLLQEAKVLRSVSHTGIPRITDTDEDGDSLMIVEDYVEGMTLSKCIQTKGAIRQDIAVQWMKQLCQIIMYLHGIDTPILYRDMKPDNVIIQPDGNIKLLDYGTCVIIYEKGQLPHGYAMGTAGYAAPEQTKKSLPCDLRSDIYGLGMTYYSMLTGLNMAGVPRDKVRDVGLMNPGVSKGLAAVVNKCIAVNPEDRYQDCNELLYALQNYITGDEGYRQKAMVKITTTAVTLALSVVLMVGSVIPFLVNKGRAEQNYLNAVQVAEQSGRQEDYVSAISLNPTNISPYFGYIEAIKIDGVFSLDEEACLLNLINPNLVSIKNGSDYDRLSYELGRLYWFYYSSSKSNEGKILSVRWFKDAKDKGYKSDLSTVYYNLGRFHKDISNSIMVAEDAGMYAEYWSNLISAKDVYAGDLVSLQINLAIAECISNYAYSLKRDSVSYEDVVSEVNDLNTFLDSFQVSEYSLDVVKELYSELRSSVEGLMDTVNLVYNGRG
jgi:serine/threonine-protein kinase